MTPVDRFQDHRRVVGAIAYRMLGSSAEAEDAVREVWIRWQSADHEVVSNDRAWLSTALTLDVSVQGDRNEMGNTVVCRGPECVAGPIVPHSPVRDTSLLLTSTIANAGLAEISVHD